METLLVNERSIEALSLLLKSQHCDQGEVCACLDLPGAVDVENKHHSGNGKFSTRSHGRIIARRPRKKTMYRRGTDITSLVPQR